MKRLGFGFGSLTVAIGLLGACGDGSVSAGMSPGAAGTAIAALKNLHHPQIVRMAYTLVTDLTPLVENLDFGVGDTFIVAGSYSNCQSPGVSILKQRGVLTPGCT